jgi:hypothetical protein
LENAIGHRSANLTFLLHLLEPDAGEVVFKFLDELPTGISPVLGLLLGRRQLGRAGVDVLADVV